MGEEPAMHGESTHRGPKCMQLSETAVLCGQRAGWRWVWPQARAVILLGIAAVRRLWCDTWLSGMYCQ